MSYTRNSRFYGIYPNAAALPPAPVEPGSTAYVNDTAGLSGGSAGTAGHVHWSGSAWVVHDLDPVATVADQQINGSMTAVVVGGVTLTPSSGNNFLIADRTVETISATAARAMSARRGIRVDASGGSVTLTLTASGPDALTTWVKRMDQTANNVTVVFSGGTIDGAASIDLLGVPAIPGGGRGEAVGLYYDPATPTDLIIL